MFRRRDPNRNGETILSACSGFLTRCYTFIFLCLFSYVFVAVLLNSKSYVPSETAVYFLALVLFGVYCVGMYWVWRFLNRSPRAWLIMIPCLLVVQGIYIWCVYSCTSSDAYVVNYIAYNSVARGLESLEDFFTDYLAYFTNNIPITQLLIGIYKIYLPASLDESWLLLSCFSAILADVTLAFTYNFVKSVWGKPSAFLTIVLGIPLIILSESATLFYTCIVSLWSVPASLYFMMKAMSSPRRVWYAAAAGACCVLGFFLKANIAVLVVAYGICFALMIMKGVWKNDASVGGAFQKRTLLKLLTILIVAGVVTYGATSLSTSSFKQDLGAERVAENEFPLEHFIAMGLNKESHGFWNGDDQEETKLYLGMDAKKEFLQEKIVRRLSEHGVRGLLAHLDYKLAFGYSRGTFVIDGAWKGTLLNDDPFAQQVQKWTVVGGAYREKYMAPFIQVVYLFVLFFCVFDVLRQSPRSDERAAFATGVCRLSMIGTTMFLLLFELNLRYIYGTLPFMIFLAVSGIRKTALWQRIALSNNVENV